MVKIFEKDGVYICEIKVETDYEKRVMSDLLKISRGDIAEKDYWTIHKKPPTLDDPYDCKGWTSVDNNIETPFDNND